MINHPTEEQQSIIEYNGNSVVTANPGSGKTFTVVEKICRVLDSLPTHKGIIAISFTNKASEELELRCKTKGIDKKQSFFGTIDKFYLTQIIIQFASHFTGKFPEYQVVESFEDYPEFQCLNNLEVDNTNQYKEILKEALSQGLILLPKFGEIALFLILNVSGVLLYMKSRYSHIFIDEYQDCGKVQHEIFMLLCNNGLVGIAVGDINQAIYGFSKRFPDYLISLFGEKRFKKFSLTKNHRCHPAINEYALCLFGYSNTIPTEKRVYNVKVEGTEIDIAKKIDKNLVPIKKKYNIENNCDIAILCRSNQTISFIDKTLATPHKVFKETTLDKDTSEWGRLFVHLLRQKYCAGCYVVDTVESFFSKELNAKKYYQALSYCNTIFKCDNEKLINTVNAFVKFAELVYPNKANKTAVEKLKLIVSDMQLLDNYIPPKENEINLMTIHKSKGLEFNIVFHTDMYQYVISNEIGSESEKKQNLNLHYVGVTRAIDVCYLLVSSKRFVKKRNQFEIVAPSSFLSMCGLNERRKNVQW